MRHHERLAVAALVLTVALLLSGCGSNGSSPKKAAAALDQALKAHAKGDLTKAKALYEQVLRNDKNNKFAIYNLGLIAQTRHDDKTATADYRKVLRIDAKYEPALFNLAILRTKAGDTKEAISLYRRAIAARSGDAGAHLNLGLLLISVGQTDEGNAEVAKAQALNPTLGQPTTTTSQP